MADIISFQVNNRFGKAEGSHLISMSVGNGTNRHEQLLQQKKVQVDLPKDSMVLKHGLQVAGAVVVVLCRLKGDQGKN